MWEVQDHPLILEFLDYMWEWPIKFQDGDSFTYWDEYQRFEVSVLESSRVSSLPEELVEPLRKADVAGYEFRAIVDKTDDVYCGSFYAAADDEGSMWSLNVVIETASDWGVSPPPFEAFSDSLFQDGFGYGNRLTLEQRDRWRYQTKSGRYEVDYSRLAIDETEDTSILSGYDWIVLLLVVYLIVLNLLYGFIHGF